MRHVTTIIIAVLALALLSFISISYLRQNYGRLVTVESDNRVLQTAAGLSIEFVDQSSAILARINRNSSQSPKDGMLMMFVPAGEFEMGSDYQAQDNPPHTVYLDGFWIDRTEVSNKMYAMCIQEGECSLPIKTATLDEYMANKQLLDHPVVYIKWEDALAYCLWAGRRLPTEAEWEKAARGLDGRVYPWGKWGPDLNLLNFDNWIGETVPVGRYPFGASPYGILNLVGNVREWVWDWYAVDYTFDSAQINPQGPEQGEKKVLRGGAFSDTKRMVRADNRFSHVPDSPGYNRGFRCAKSP